MGWLVTKVNHRLIYRDDSGYEVIRVSVVDREVKMYDRVIHFGSIAANPFYPTEAEKTMLEVEYGVEFPSQDVLTKYLMGR